MAYKCYLSISYDRDGGQLHCRDLHPTHTLINAAVDSGPFRASSPATRIAEITHVIKTGYFVCACGSVNSGTYLRNKRDR